MSKKILCKVMLICVICISIQCSRKDQIDPTCYIINPQDNSMVSGAIRIKAVAMDNKEVTYAEFFINNVRKGVDSTASNSVYEYIWNPGSATGTQTIVARAYDQAGNVGESPSIIVTIATTGPTYHSGEITTPQTWTKRQSPHIITEDLLVEARLTIEAGAVIQFSAGTQIEVNDGDIIARGTNLEPIVFTSNEEEPYPGDWERIIFNRMLESQNTIFDNCVIEYANIGIYLQRRSISVINSQIQNNSQHGLVCNDGRFKYFYNNVITRNGDYPISITPDAVSTLGTNNSWSGNNNGYDAIEVIYGNIGHSGTWRNQGVPYIITDHIYLEYEYDLPVTLTIEPGCIIAFDRWGGAIEIYEQATLNASGVTFTSTDGLQNQGGPGDWDGIFVYDGSLNLQNCIVEYGGSGDEAVIFIQSYQTYSSISIDNCIIRYNATSGISLDIHEIGDAYITNTRITYNYDYPLILYNPEYIRALGPGNNFAGNGNDVIWICINNNEVLTSGTWYNCNVPYYIDQDDIVICQGWQNYPPKITIMPGVIMQFGFDACLIVEDGTLIADGSAGQIVFTNAEEDDNWGGIIFNDGTNDNLTRLNHCIIQYGGSRSYSGNANIFCQNSAPRITNCDICYSSGWGMTLHNSALNPDTLRRYNRFYANNLGDIRILPNWLKVAIKSIGKAVKTKSTSIKILQPKKNRLIQKKTLTDKANFIDQQE